VFLLKAEGEKKKKLAKKGQFGVWGRGGRPKGGWKFEAVSFH